MTDLFGSDTVPETRRQYLKRKKKELFNANGTPRHNPMLQLYGETPGQKCKNCAYLCVKEYANRYYKCRLRSCSGSPTTDHRVNFPACGKFELREEKL